MTAPPDPPASDAPSVRRVRARLRRARRPHRQGQMADRATDIYTIALTVVILAAMVGSSLHGTPPAFLVASPSPAPAAALLLAAVLVALGGVAVALDAVGPLYAGGATRTWLLSTPTDRARWLRPRSAWLVAVAMLTGSAGGLATGALAHATGSGGVGSTTLLGAALAVALVSAAITGQAHPAAGSIGRRSTGRRSAVRWAGSVLLVAGLVGLVAAVVLDRTASAPVHLGGSWLPPALSALAIVAAIAAVAGCVRAARSLGRIDRAALGGGAELAGSAVTAAISIDPSLLYEHVETARLRRLGRVRHRPLRPRRAAAGRPRIDRSGTGRAAAALVAADLRRLTRHRGAALRAVALALTVYAAGIVLAPTPVTLLRVLAGYVAVNGFASGLRTVSRSPSLRRMLGRTDGWLRGVHLVVPVIAAVVWTAVTAGAGRHLDAPAVAVLFLGVVGAVLRSATRKPMVYDVAWAVTPMGTVPVGLFTQVFRGPDVAAVAAVLCALVL